MTMTVEQMREATDDQLIQWQDEVATGRAAGHDYYLGELRARQSARAIDAADNLAHRAYWLTVASTALVVVAAVVAVVALFLR